MEIATQTSLTGLSVLWDINIVPTAGFFTIDIKEEILNYDYSDDVGCGWKDDVRKKIDEQIIREISKKKNIPTKFDEQIMKELNKNKKVPTKFDEQIIKEMNRKKNVPAMTSIDLNVLNEYSANVTTPNTRKELCEAIQSTPNQKRKSEKEPAVIKKLASLENEIIIKSSHINESLNSTFKSPTKSADDTKKSSNIENKSPMPRDLSPSKSPMLRDFSPSKSPKPAEGSPNKSPKPRDWSPSKSMQKAFKSFCTTKVNVSPIKQVSNLNAKNKTPKNKKLNIKKNTKEILKEKTPSVKKTIRKSTNKNKNVIKSLKNVASSYVMSSHSSNFKKSLRDSLEIEEIIISDDDDIADADTFSDGNNRDMKNSEENKEMDNKQKFKCSFCDFETLFKEPLIKHIMKHTGMKPFACEKCDFKCSRKDYLKRHMDLHDSDVAIYKCTECELQFVTKNLLKQHLLTHNFEKGLPIEHLKCSYCNYTAISNTRLSMHTRKHTGEKPYACEKCDYKCARPDSLKVHMHMHSCETLSCSECDYTTNDKIEFQKHKNIHKGEKKFQCTECPSTHKSQNALDKHILIHSVNKKCICSECGISYELKESLKQHMDSEHGQSQKYTCKECELSFSSQEEIDSHLLTHPLKNSCKYVNCDYKGVDISSLKQHIKSHYSSQLSFHCKDCGRMFSEKKKLRVHRNKKHKFEEKFYCSKCSYQCIKEEHLKDHMQTHLYSDVRTFACSICDTLCSGIHSFEEHMKQHTAQK